MLAFFFFNNVAYIFFKNKTPRPTYSLLATRKFSFSWLVIYYTYYRGRCINKTTRKQACSRWILFCSYMSCAKQLINLPCAGTILLCCVCCDPALFVASAGQKFEHCCRCCHGRCRCRCCCVWLRLLTLILVLIPILI